MTQFFSLIFFEENLLAADFSLLVVLLIFVVLIFILDALIFKPVSKVLDDRERLTSGAMHEAKKATHDYEKQLTNYEDKIRSARAESYQMLENQRKTAIEERNKKLAGVKAQVTEKIEANKRDLGATSNQAKTRLESDARAMAELISRNLLKRPLGGPTS